MARLTMTDVQSVYEEEDRETWSREKRPARKGRMTMNAKNASDMPVVRHTDTGQRVLVWTNTLDTNAWRQSEQFASLPFIHPKGLALMPDVHLGRDVPVGSVLPTMGALVPAAVGTDIGCGMIAVQLDLRAQDLPDHLKPMRLAIEQAIPLGAGGRRRGVSDRLLAHWKPLAPEYASICAQHPLVARASAPEQLGTLGSGNHFIEVCLDERQQVWVMLHSGSRGVGGGIGQHFIDVAARRAKTHGTAIGKLGWFPDDDPLFHDYARAVAWAQEFAAVNRQVMLEDTLAAISTTLGKTVRVVDQAIQCHHNYIAQETHHGDKMWVTRKGAIRAGLGELGIVPGSMGTESFIVRGKGNTDSYCSCAHGAGRVLSRTAAQAQFTVADLKLQTRGVECRKIRSLVDEIPSAYKPIRLVMNEQSGLVDVVHTLKAVICVKGA